MGHKTSWRGGGGTHHASSAEPHSGPHEDFVNTPNVDNLSDYTVGNMFGHRLVPTDILTDSKSLRSAISWCQEINMCFRYRENMDV